MRLNGLGRNKHMHPANPLCGSEKRCRGVLRLHQAVSVSKRTSNGSDLATCVDFLGCRSLPTAFLPNRLFLPLV